MSVRYRKGISIEQMERLLGQMLAEGAQLDDKLWFQTTVPPRAPLDDEIGVSVRIKNIRRVGRRVVLTA